MAPIKLTKPFSTLPKFLDIIDEEENFSLIPQIENKKHDSTKLVEHFSKHYEEEPNLIENVDKQKFSPINPNENLSTRFGLSKTSSKNILKTGM